MHGALRALRAPGRRSAGQSGRRDAAAWRANIGGPVAIDAPATAAPADHVHVLCWNIAVGRARVRELIELVHARHGVGEPDGPPFIVLLQEAYRADASVPDVARGRAHGGAIQPAEPEDIAIAAARLGLSLRYVPSMRNGVTRSDRGNAILTNLAVADAIAIQLPIARQHRVAVGVRLAGLPDAWFVSAHLDVRGAPPAPGRARRWSFGAGRVAQAAALADRLARIAGSACVVLGGDFNTHAGRADPALRQLGDAGFDAARGAHGHTFHGPLPLALDHVLVRSSAGTRVTDFERIGACGVWPAARVLGSDHHPLHARVRIGPREPAPRR